MTIHKRVLVIVTFVNRYFWVDFFSKMNVFSLFFVKPQKDKAHHPTSKGFLNLNCDCLHENWPVSNEPANHKREKVVHVLWIQIIWILEGSKSNNLEYESIWWIYNIMISIDKNKTKLDRTGSKPGNLEK